MTKKNTRAILMVCNVVKYELIEKKALFISADNEMQIEHFLRTRYLDDIVQGYIETADDCYKEKREPAGFLRWINRGFFVDSTTNASERRDKDTLHFLQLVMDNKIGSERVILGSM